MRLCGIFHNIIINVYFVFILFCLRIIISGTSQNINKLDSTDGTLPSWNSFDTKMKDGALVL